MIHLPRSSRLNTLSRYPNWHFDASNRSKAPSSMRTASNQAKWSLTSTPYAPMFCMGLAPTLPGMRDKFSKPCHPSSSVCITNPCHGSPAPAETMASVVPWGETSTPRMSTCKTNACTSPCNSMLLPPPRTNSGTSRSLAQASAARNCVNVVTRANHLAFEEIPNVVHPANSTCAFTSKSGSSTPGDQTPSKASLEILVQGPSGSSMSITR